MQATQFDTMYVVRGSCSFSFSFSAKGSLAQKNIEAPCVKLTNKGSKPEDLSDRQTNPIRQAGESKVQKGRLDGRRQAGRSKGCEVAGKVGKN